MGDNPPNQTVYVQNINEKLSQDELKKALHAAFVQFGKIIDIVAARTYRLRGQAWVVFADITAATTAIRSMQGFPLFEKPIRVSFAKEKSDAAAKLDGTFVCKDRRQERQRRKEEDQLRAQRGGKHIANGSAATGTANLTVMSAADVNAPPNHILFVQGLPEGATAEMLSSLFSQFPGYVESRPVPAKPGIAFVEFDGEDSAAASKDGLNDFALDSQHRMRITFAKK